MADPRVSGRLGQPIDLNVIFYRNGVATDPFAIRRIKIYRSSVSEENLIDTIDVVSPDDPSYPSPIVKSATGSYVYTWNVPCDIPVPDIFFDVWEFLGTDCRTSEGCDGPAGTDCLDDEDLWLSQCNQFWLYPDGWYLDSGLAVIRLGFEALDLKLYQPECRTIEVGVMPLPLYDFDYNLIAPIIPQMRAFIKFQTVDKEVICDWQPMTIGLRQGSYRSNPFTLQYYFCSDQITCSSAFDECVAAHTPGSAPTSVTGVTDCPDDCWQAGHEQGVEDACETASQIPLFKGTYTYRVMVMLPNGETRVSPDFILQIS